MQALRLGTSKECFPDDSYIMQCDFAMFFNVRRTAYIWFR